MSEINRIQMCAALLLFLVVTIFVFTTLIFTTGCDRNHAQTVSLDIPRGYVPTLEIEKNGHLIRFGPFEGYYFKPDSDSLENFSRLTIVCFNEKSFYTRDLPENSLLFEGEAVMTTLENIDVKKEGENRIFPVFFNDAPDQWTKNRPHPIDEFVHFHSCYDAAGPVLSGYWIRHRGVAAFTYDMGRRVNKKSPLYHRVIPGIDKDFARIIEFDRGPF
jgi:hypothetical protein